jgi:ABC-type nitrate/sulfonate/bicarbonate transport system substrate-binding protein
MNYLIHFFFKLQSIKWRLLAVLVLLCALMAVFYFYYPKSVVTIGVQTLSLTDGQPKPKSRLAKLKDYLAENGVELRFKSQLNNTVEKPNLEFLINDPEVDFVYDANTGAMIAEDVVDRFSSLGAISKSPILFYVKTGRTNLKNLKDLKGKKIIFWTSPEGNETPAFSSKDAKASIYSSDYILESLFKQIGVTPDNTELKNVWPKKVDMSQDWDVWITMSGLPTKNANNSHDLWNEIASGRVELVVFDDLEGVSRRLSHLEFNRLPVSAHMPSRAIPKTDVPYLSYTHNVIVRNDLDPSIVMLLAEFQKNNFSGQTVLSDKGTYPNFSQTGSFKPNKTAEDFYANGRPFLSKHLSPGLSAFILKILLILVPALTILWPITHFVPAAYHFYVKHKITHWYKDLEFIERNYLKADEDTRAMMKNQIQEIQLALQELKFPIMHLHYVQELFIAKEHVELIRKRYNI